MAVSEAERTSAILSDLGGLEERMARLRVGGDASAAIGVEGAVGGAGAKALHRGAALDSDDHHDSDGDYDDEEEEEEDTKTRRRAKAVGKGKAPSKSKDISPARSLAGTVNGLRRSVANTTEALTRSQVALAAARAALVGTVTKPATWTDSVMRLFKSEDGTLEPEHASMALIAEQDDPALMAAYATYFVAKAEDMALHHRLMSLTDELDAAIQKHDEFKEAEARAAEAQRTAARAAEDAYQATLLGGAIGGAAGGAAARRASPGRARAGSAGARARTPSRR